MFNKSALWGMVVSCLCIPPALSQAQQISLSKCSAKTDCGISFSAKDKTYQPVTTEQAFYKYKIQNTINSMGKTYQDRYATAAYVAWPRTYWSDIVPNQYPVNQPGVLFMWSLQDTYERLLHAKSNVRKETDKALKQVILNPRRDEITQAPTVPAQNSIMTRSLMLASLYEQLDTYIYKMRDLKASYQEYTNALQKQDKITLSGYQETGMVPIFNAIRDIKYNEQVLQNAQSSIRSFMYMFVNDSASFIKTTLVPLQTSQVAKADVKQYLQSKISGNLPAGISKTALVNSLMTGISSPEEYYNQAQAMFPSAGQSAKALGKTASGFLMMHAGAQQANGQLFQQGKDMMSSNAGKGLAMLDYIAPSHYAKNLREFDSLMVPNEEKVSRTAEMLAANDLNRSIAQTTNEIFEIYKAFYYQYHSFNNQEQIIAKTWYELASNQIYGEQIIGRMAAESLLHSGKRSYQNKQFAAALNRQRMGDSYETFNKKVMPLAEMALDFVPLLDPLNLIGPVFKGANRAAHAVAAGLEDAGKALKTKKVATSTTKTAKVLETETKALGGATKHTSKAAAHGASPVTSSASGVPSLSDNARVTTQSNTPKVRYPQGPVQPTTSKKVPAPAVEMPTKPSTDLSGTSALPTPQTPAATPKADAVAATQIESKLAGPLDNKVANAKSKYFVQNPDGSFVQRSDVGLADDIMSGASEPAKAKKPGFFKRLFGSKKAQEPAVHRGLDDASRQQALQRMKEIRANKAAANPGIEIVNRGKKDPGIEIVSRKPNNTSAGKVVEKAPTEAAAAEKAAAQKAATEEANNAAKQASRAEESLAKAAHNIPSATPSPTSVATNTTQVAQRVSELGSQVRNGWKGAFSEISENLTKARQTSLTPAQRARVEKAERYFSKLTPEQANDWGTLTSREFQEHAAVLRSPTATEQAFYVEGAGFEDTFFRSAPNMQKTKGYIPSVVGEPTKGFVRADLQEAFKVAEQTNQPILVQLTSHGEIDATGFYIPSRGLSNSAKVRTADLVDDLQMLRKTTGTPEINLQLDACHSGKFMQEFEALPQAKRAGINVYAHAGGVKQENLVGPVSAMARSRGTGSISSSQTHLLIKQIEGRNVFARGYINGTSFNPLQQAALRAKAEANPLANELNLLYRLQNANGTEVNTIMSKYKTLSTRVGFSRGNNFTATSVTPSGNAIRYISDTAQKMLSGQRW